MKKIITIMLSFVLALCFSVTAFAANPVHIGYYAILKDKFSPTDPLIMNHLVKYVGQNPEYYRFYNVYASHNHELDEYHRYPDVISLRIHTAAMAYPVEPTAQGWKEIESTELADGIIATGVNVKLSGTFGATPSMIIVNDSLTGDKQLYINDKCTGFESLNINTALVDILNITGPHPGWASQISGSKGLPY